MVNGNLILDTPYTALGIFDTTAKLEGAISHIENKQCAGDGELIGKHLSIELEIFEAAGKYQTVA